MKSRYYNSYIEVSSPLRLSRFRELDLTLEIIQQTFLDMLADNIDYYHDPKRNLAYYLGEPAKDGIKHFIVPEYHDLSQFIDELKAEGKEIGYVLHGNEYVATIDIVYMQNGKKILFPSESGDGPTSVAIRQNDGSYIYYNY